MTALALPPQVDIREVGPRDGLQIEDPVPIEGKRRLLAALAATGARRIEATAFVSPRAVPAMADAEQVGEIVAGLQGIEWSALVAGVNGAARAVAAGMRTLEYVVSAGDGHSRANVGRGTEESLALVGEISDVVHAAGGRCEVIIATAWDCPFDGPTPPAATVRIAQQSVAAGADQICLGDTIGTVGPGRVVCLVDAVRDAVPDVPLGAHFHDTRGQGIANALAAMQAGVTQLDASVGGMGGCPFAPGASGNIATEELVYLLEESGVSSGLDLDSVLDAARLAQELLGHDLPSGLLTAGGRSVPRNPVPRDGAAGPASRLGAAR